MQERDSGVVGKQDEATHEDSESVGESAAQEHESTLEKLTAEKVYAYCYEAHFEAAGSGTGYRSRSTRHLDWIRQFPPDSVTYQAYGLGVELSAMAEEPVTLQEAFGDQERKKVKLDQKIGLDQGAVVIMDDQQNRLRNLLFLYRNKSSPDQRRPLSSLLLTIPLDEQFSDAPEEIVRGLMPSLIPELEGRTPSNPGEEITIDDRIYFGNPTQMIESLTQKDPVEFARKSLQYRKAPQGANYPLAG